MPIIGIEGGIGQGKTTAMTFFALQEYIELRKPIFSNYHLNEIPHTYLTFEDLMRMMEQEYDFERAALFITEAHVWIDSRMSASRLSRLFTYFMLQTGKMDINLYYDTQDFRQVDIRLRKMTDIAVNVSRKGNRHILKMKDMRNGRVQTAALDGSQVYHLFNTREVAKYKRTNTNGDAKA